MNIEQVIELVEKWLEDNSSVTVKELEDAADAAYAAANVQRSYADDNAYADAAEAAYYAATYAEAAANWATYATAYAADAEAAYADAADLNSDRAAFAFLAAAILRFSAGV